TRNHADQLVYQTEKLLRDNAANLSEQDKAPLTSAIERVKQAASGEDVNAIKQALSDLEQAVHAMSQHLYQRQQTAGARGGAGGASEGSKGGGGREGGVIGAELEVKKYPPRRGGARAPGRRRSALRLPGVFYAPAPCHRGPDRPYWQGSRSRPPHVS